MGINAIGLIVNSTLREVRFFERIETLHGQSALKPAAKLASPDSPSGPEFGAESAKSSKQRPLRGNPSNSERFAAVLTVDSVFRSRSVVALTFMVSEF